MPRNLGTLNALKRSKRLAKSKDPLPAEYPEPAALLK
jgi:hypothetical protein